MKKEEIRNIMNKAFNSDLVKQEFHEIEEVEVTHLFPYELSGVINYEPIILLTLKPDKKWHVSRRMKLEQLLVTIMKMLGFYGNNEKMYISTKKGEE